MKHFALMASASAAALALPPMEFKGDDGGDPVELVTKSLEEDSGDLKGSIAVTGPGQSTPAYSQPGGSMSVADNAVAVTVGDTDVRYAHLVEYGHGNGLHGSIVPAHPFFWPAVRLHRKKATTAIKSAVRRAVRKSGGAS